jgi:uncharacterized protein (TIGR00375 family)
MGLDARDLLELLLDCSPDIFFIPAHIWTPWFSMLGANSGFDSLAECYRDMAPYIYSVETGLSSDPPMNWLCSFLDKYTLVSNSDAHSPEKLGRNANIFNTDISYDAVTSALKSGNPADCLGTIDMYPQEGKYHYAGHLKCGICWNPAETQQNKGLCTVCGKKITNGVMNRVAQLSDRKKPTDRQNRLPFYYAIPLKELLSEITGSGENTRQVVNAYNRLLSKFGNELGILLDIPVDELKKGGNEILAEGIGRMRSGNIHIQHGFDGQYGIIKVFSESEIIKVKTSGLNIMSLDLAADSAEKKNPKNKTQKTKHETPIVTELQTTDSEISTASEPLAPLSTKNEDQSKAISHNAGPALVMAGPGTGKTYILTHRIVSLIKEKNVRPESILAITFTNKAANEMKHRIDALIGNKEISSKINVSTFHAFGLSILKEHFRLARRKKNFIIIGEQEKISVLEEMSGFDKTESAKLSGTISDIKQNIIEVDRNLVDTIRKYEAKLSSINAFDLDDLIFYPVRIFGASPLILRTYIEKFRWILIDEYQDINNIQYQLIKLLTPSSDSNLFAIGDANQAIYGFRGADVKFIRQFVIDNPTAVIYRLRQSYRCSDIILKASHQVITQTSDLKPLTSLSGISEGIRINIVKNTSDRSEAEFIARTIEKMIGGLRFFSMDSGISDGSQTNSALSLSDFAILCRLSRQFDVIEKALNDHSIPFQTVGNTPFFRQDPVEKIIDFLKYSINPDNTYLKEKLLKEKVIDGSDFRAQVAGFRDMPVSRALNNIISLYFRNELSKDEQIIRRLISLADDFGSNINAFLEYTTLGIAPDAFRHGIENLTLMTLHASKGLEFKCVFIAGCEEGIIPFSLFDNRLADIEEEKRLLYVGMTRAKSFLWLSHADRRFLFGKEYSLPKSSFISGIEQDLANIQSEEKKKKPKKETNQLDLF